MEYVVAGVLASSAMLLYGRRVSASSPLAAMDLPSDWLKRRQEGRGGAIASVAGLIFSWGILAFVAGARRGPGTDFWLRYVPIFEQVSHGWSVETDPGFLLINRLVAYFTDDFQWLFVVMAVATIGLVYRLVVRMSVHPAISIYIYVFGGFYLESFNLMRQWLAIAILLNTVEFLLTRRLWLFVGLTLLASTLHPSALIWLILWPASRGRLGIVARTLGIAGGVAAIALFPDLIREQAVRLAPSYAWYFDSNYGELRTFDPYGVLIAFVILMASTPALRHWGTISTYVRVVLNLQAVQILALVAAIALEYAFSRLTYYFTPVQMLITPLFLSSIRSRPARSLATIVIMVAYAAAFYLKFVLWNSHGVLPYESLFSS